MSNRWGSWDFDTHPDTIRALCERMNYCDVCDRDAGVPDVRPGPVRRLPRWR